MKLYNFNPRKLSLDIMEIVHHWRDVAEENTACMILMAEETKYVKTFVFFKALTKNPWTNLCILI